MLGYYRAQVERVRQWLVDNLPHTRKPILVIHVNLHEMHESRRVANDRQGVSKLLFPQVQQALIAQRVYDE